MNGTVEHPAEVLLDSAPDAIFFVDSAGEVTYANKRVQDILGYDPDEIIGQQVEQLLPEGLREEHVSHREAFMDDPSQRPMGVGLDLQARRADGSTVPVNVSLNPVDTGNGVGVMAAVRDVTEQRKHKQQITRLRAATRQLMDATTEEDVAQIVATVAADIFGYESCVSRLVDDGEHLRPVAVVGGDRVGLRNRPDYPLDEDTPVTRVYRSGDPEIYDDVRTLVDGYDRGEARAAMYVPIGDYGVLSVLDAEADVFEQHDLDIALSLTANAETILERIYHESELKCQIDRLDKFAGVVSHDLRNPLNTAQLRVDMAETGGDELDDVVDALDRMEEIIEYTLTLVRQGDDVGETEPVAVGEFAAQCWRRIDAPNATLRIAEDASVRCDRSRLQHVFENLFRNAVEHAPSSPDSRARQDGGDHAGDDVTLTVGRLPDDAGLYVEDDGPGIPADDRADVFEQGYTSDGSGTGLGLAIVREIVEAHGWEISVTDADCGGARFEITGVDFVE